MCKLFTVKFGKFPLSMSGANKLVAKLKDNCAGPDAGLGCKITVLTYRNIAMMKRFLERAASRSTGKQGPTARRHHEPIKKSSYNSITKKDRSHTRSSGCTRELKCECRTLFFQLFRPLHLLRIIFLMISRTILLVQGDPRTDRSMSLMHGKSIIVA